MAQKHKELLSYGQFKQTYNSCLIHVKLWINGALIMWFIYVHIGKKKIQFKFKLILSGSRTMNLSFECLSMMHGRLFHFLEFLAYHQQILTSFL